MIQISLLPQDERKGKAKKGPVKATAETTGGLSVGATLFALVALAGVGALGYRSWSKLHEAKIRFEARDAEKRRVESEVASLSEKAREIQELRKVLTNQWEILQSLDPPERILWSEKMNMLANLMPANIFLMEINLVEHVTEVEIQASIDAREKWEADGRKGPRPEAVKKPVISHTLTLKGVATGGDHVEQFDNVIKFHDALMAYETTNALGEPARFMDSFSKDIRFVSIDAVLYEGVPVNQFTFDLRTEVKTTTAASTAGQ